MEPIPQNEAYKHGLSHITPPFVSSLGTVQIGTSVAPLRFILSIGSDAESAVECDGCSAPCCRTSKMIVLLTPNEVRSGDYPFQCAKFVLAGGEEIHWVPVLARHPVSLDCVFLGPDARCTIYSRRPLGCRKYDCRRDERLKEFASQRFGTDGRRHLPVIP